MNAGGNVLIRVIPLGSNGYYPSHGRQTMCFLVLKQQQAILLDAGTGAARLAEDEIAALAADYENLDVILSHYHLDHVVGLSYLPSVWRRGRIRVYAPAPPFVPEGPDVAVRRLLSPPLVAAEIEQFRVPFELVPVETPEFRVGATAVRVWGQTHPGGSIGIRIGDDVAYVTDTGPDLANVSRVNGARLLIHELWLTDAEAAEENTPGHSSVSGVADFVRASNLGEVMLVHHRPVHDAADIARMAADVSGKSGRVAFPGEDGVIRELR